MLVYLQSINLYKFNYSYKLYQAIEKLRAVEYEFAKALGIPVNPEMRTDQVSITIFNISGSVVIL